LSSANTPPAHKPNVEKTVTKPQTPRSAVMAPSPVHFQAAFSLSDKNGRCRWHSTPFGAFPQVTRRKSATSSPKKGANRDRRNKVFKAGHRPGRWFRPRMVAGLHPETGERHLKLLERRLLTTSPRSRSTPQWHQRQHCQPCHPALRRPSSMCS
jgi:hypothetical protein